VYELVQNMKKKRQDENITSREFNHMIGQDSSLTPYVQDKAGSLESMTGGSNNHSSTHINENQTQRWASRPKKEKG